MSNLDSTQHGFQGSSSSGPHNTGDRNTGPHHNEPPTTVPFSPEIHNIDERSQRELDRITGVAHPKLMAVPLHILVPLLIDAQENDATWLRDFSSDLVMIDSDLHEILLAYANLKQRRAA